MSADLDRLAELLPPPGDPGCCTATAPFEDGDRFRLSGGLPGVHRPLRQWRGRSGAITFRPLIGPCSQPLRPDHPRGLSRLVDRHLDNVRPAFTCDGADEEMWDEDDPAYRTYPDAGGLLAWGENEAGDIFFWLTQDPDPDRWPVVMWACGPVCTFSFESGTVAFILALLDGDHPASVLLSEPGLHWSMNADWLRSGLKESRA